MLPGMCGVCVFSIVSVHTTTEDAVVFCRLLQLLVVCMLLFILLLSNIVCVLTHCIMITSNCLG